MAIVNFTFNLRRNFATAVVFDVSQLAFGDCRKQYFRAPVTNNLAWPDAQLRDNNNSLLCQFGVAVRTDYRFNTLDHARLKQAQISLYNEESHRILIELKVNTKLYNFPCVVKATWATFNASITRDDISETMGKIEPLPCYQVVVLVF